MPPIPVPTPFHFLIKPLIKTGFIRTRVISLRLDMYHTYSSPTHIVIKGRALEKKSTDRPLEVADSPWVNIKRTWHALESDEVPGLDLTIRFENENYAVTTDNEGLFRLELQLQKALAPGVYNVQANLARTTAYNADTGLGKVFVYPETASLGVISDIDDTILETDVTRKRDMIKKLAFGNALTAVPVKGMATLYQTLFSAGYGFHYLSGSPINLHQRLRAFLKHQGFPPGSMDLRHWGIGAGTDAIFSSKTYKIQRLQTLFQQFPARKFILIGDSGEKDPEIYATLKTGFADQILLIAIHNVTRSSKQETRFKGMLLFEAPEQVQAQLESLGLNIGTE